MFYVSCYTGWDTGDSVWQVNGIHNELATLEGVLICCYLMLSLLSHIKFVISC